MTTRSFDAEIARFNRLYADHAAKGLTAFQTLQKMKREGWIGVDIAKAFEVSQNTVSNWNNLFFPKVDSLS